MAGILESISYNSQVIHKAYRLRYNERLSIVLVLGIFSLLFLNPPNNALSQELEKKTNENIACNCVVFRLDDIQDDFVDTAQIAAMNIFIERNQSLSLGIIMNDIGKDLRITGKVGEGSQIGLFEMGIHGWDHIDYTKLSGSEQRTSLAMANEKMKQVFGNSSDIFVPPYGYFDNSTLRAMNDLGIRIISAALFSELNFDRGNSIFNYSSNRSMYGNSELGALNTRPIHIPGLVAYKAYENGMPIGNSSGLLLKGITDNIQEYGYSVVVFHPQDFVYTDAGGRISSESQLNMTEVDEFSQLVDNILSNNIRIATLSDIAGVERRDYSYFN